MADVYLGRHMTSGQVVAVKVARDRGCEGDYLKAAVFAHAFRHTAADSCDRSAHKTLLGLRVALAMTLPLATASKKRRTLVKVRGMLADAM